MTASGRIGYNGQWGTGHATVFRVTPSGILTSLYQSTEDVMKFGGVLQAGDRNLYGTTRAGGTCGFGTIFWLSVPMQPALKSISQTNRKAGRKVQSYVLSPD